MKNCVWVVPEETAKSQVLADDGWKVQWIYLCFTSSGSQQIPHCHQRAERARDTSQSFPLLRLPAAVPCRYFDTLQIIWLSFKQPSKWALMCFSELLSIALLVSRPRRLLRVDSPLTQRAIHPSSEQNVTFVALQPFKSHRLVKRRPIMITVFFCVLTCNYLESVM